MSIKPFFIVEFLLAITICLTFITSLPTPTLQDNSGWKVTHSTDVGYTYWINNASAKKTEIGLIPPNNSCAGQLDRKLFGADGLPIKDDKNKDIVLKCESAKCSGQNCYHISLTTAQAININDYIKIGEFSTTYEWINSTLYIYNNDTLDIDPFSIEVIYDGIKQEYPNAKWISIDAPIGEGIPFYLNISNFTSRSNVTFRMNKLEDIEIITDTQFLKETRTHYINFNDFEAKNNITSKEIKPNYNSWGYCFIQEFPYVWQLNDCMNIPISYDVTYYGLIIDLDPVLQEVFSSSSGGYYNQTQATSLGVSLQINSSVVYPSGLYNVTQGDYRSFVFYNSTSTYWNVTLGIADSNGSAEVYNLCQADANCVSYWDLDIGNMNTSINADEKGSQHGTITCYGPACAASELNSTGVSSGSLQFDGVNDYFSTPAISPTIGTSNFTFALWFKTSGNYATTPGTLMTNRDGSAKQASLSLDSTIDNTIMFVTYDGSATSVNSILTYNDGNWHHVVGTRSGTNLYLYVDGRLENSASGTIRNVSSTAILTIGANGLASQWPLNGSIDEVMRFNDSLTASEVSQLYKSGLSQHANTNITLQTRTASSYNLTDTALRSFWSFNDDNTTTVFDLMGKNNGTKYGDIINSNASAGIVGDGYYFDGVNDYYNFSANFTTTTMSICAWAKPDNTDAVGYMFYGAGGTISLQQTNPLTGYWVFFYDTAASTGRTLQSLSSPTGDWQFICGTADGSTSRLYVDGVFQISGISNGITLGDGTQWFGVDSSLASDFKGSIDEIRIYDRALSAGEILNLYNLGAYHINWDGGENNWTTAQTVSDGVPITSSETKFIQFRANLNTNSTAVSPYLINYSVGVGEAPYTPPSDTTYPQFNNIIYLPDQPEYNPNLIVYVNATVTNTNGTVGIMFNGTNYTMSNVSDNYYINLTGLNRTYPNYYSYYIWAYGNGSLNLFNISTENQMTILYNFSSCDVYPSTLSPITYPSTMMVQTNCTTPYIIRLDGNIVQNDTSLMLGAGNHTFTINRTDADNYYYAYDEFNYTVNKGFITTNVLINNAYGDYNSNTEEFVWLNGSLNPESTTSPMWLELNGTRINEGSSPLSNYTYLTYGYYNFSVGFDGDENWTSYIGTSWINITQIIDSNYPIFSNPTYSPSTPINYLPTNNYWLNITIENTNGTAGIEIDGINYSSSNISNIYYNYFSTLSAITHQYYFWAYGNGTNNNYNISEALEYRVDPNPDNCDVLFNETSPLVYNALFEVYSNCNSPFVLYRDGEIIANNSEQNLGGGNYNFTVYRNDTQNYSYTSDEEMFTIDKSSDYSISIDASPSWNEDNNTAVTISGSGCVALGLDCMLYVEGIEKVSPYIFTYTEGSYLAVWNTTGNQNYTAKSVNNTLIITNYTAPPPAGNVTTTSVATCRYCKLGYYNLKLPWLRERNCIC